MRAHSFGSNGCAILTVTPERDARGRRRPSGVSRCLLHGDACVPRLQARGSIAGAASSPGIARLQILCSMGRAVGALTTSEKPCKR